jgi:signal transduction histidine kinase
MGWQHTPFVYPTLFATAVSLLIGLFTLAQVRERGRTPTLVAFLGINVGLVLWTGFSALKLLSTDPATKLLAYRLLYLGNAPLGGLVILFALAYTDRDRWLRRPVVALLFVVPVAYVALLFANPFDLAIASTRFTEFDGLVVLRVDTGPAHLPLVFVYNAGLALLAAGIVGYEAVRLGRAYLPQAMLLGVAPLTPIAFSVLSSAGVPVFALDGVNVVPTSAAVVSVAFGTAVFRYRLLDLPPIAYTTAIRDSPDGVLVVDDRERVVHANRAGQELLDRQPGTVGDPIDAVVPGFDPDAEAAATIETTDGDGPATLLDVRSQPLVRHGTTVGRVVVLRDVTERRLQRRQLEAQTQQLERFASIVSHDLRNPLAVAVGYLSVLEEEYDDDRLGTIGDALDRMDRIVEDTLALAREGRAVTEPEWTDLDELARDSWRHVETGDATLEVADAVRIRCDPDRVRHLLENLFRNAVDHGGDDVRVRLERLEPDGFAVEDDGPGVPVEDRERAFDPGHTTTAGGTGFGLAIVDGVVEAHGWDVALTESAAGGARFEVTGVDVES